MADEPSIDEILASLDRLLKEGEGRNDEPEAAPPAADEPASPSHPDAPTPHFFEVLDEEAEAGHADADEPVDAAEPAAQPQADEAPEGEAGSRLFVLTDAMMVDDQPSLPLGTDGEAEAVEAPEQDLREALAMPESEAPQPAEPELVGMPEFEPADEAQPEMHAEPEPVGMPEFEPADEPQPGMHAEPQIAVEPVPAAPSGDALAAAIWNETDVQALVDQVTDDVCSAMAERLPEMIRMALAVRLSAFIDAYTNHQDTGTQE